MGQAAQAIREAGEDNLGPMSTPRATGVEPQVSVYVPDWSWFWCALWVQDADGNPKTGFCQRLALVESSLGVTVSGQGGALLFEEQQQMYSLKFSIAWTITGFFFLL